MNDEPITARDRWIAAALAVAVFLILFVSERDLGVAWDEPIYTTTGERIVVWLGLWGEGLRRGDLSAALDPTAIGHGFGLGHEHPPLAKLASGLGWALTRAWLPLPTAHRVGPMAISALLLTLIYWALRQTGVGRAAALVGGLAPLAMPRLFYHLHVAALDAPAAAAWFVFVWAFWRLSERRRWWAWLLPGAVLGLALATKLSAIVAPVAVGLWLLVGRERRRRWDLWGRLVLAGPLSFLVVLALYPWFWSETWPKLVFWVRFFTVSHYEIPQYYLGRVVLGPPWHFPLVIVLTTTPATLLALAAIGATRRASRRGSTLSLRARFQAPAGRSSHTARPSPESHIPSEMDRDPQGEAAALWLINALTMIVWFMRPGSNPFDNDRLLTPTFVFLAPLAGLGFAALVAWLRERTPFLAGARSSLLASLVLATIALGPGLIAIVRLHPYELAYYNAVIGGLRGGQRLGLETIYWATTYRAALPEVNRRAAPGATLWVTPNSYDVLYYYQRAGLLRADLAIMRPPGWGSFYDDSGVNRVEGEIGDADFALIEYRQTSFVDAVPAYMAQRQPLWALERDGVILAALYAR